MKFIDNMKFIDACEIQKYQAEYFVFSNIQLGISPPSDFICSAREKFLEEFQIINI